MSQKKAAQLTLEVRRIRKSARVGFIDDYATCSKTLVGLLTTGVKEDQAVVVDSAQIAKPLTAQ